jgi:twitching motility protein PilT
LHVAPDLPPFLRIHGILEPQGDIGPLDAGMTAALGDVLARGFDRRSLNTTGSIDGALTAADGTRFRFNVFKRQSTISIALRRLEDRFRTLVDLGLPDALYELCSLPDGLVVVAGPTGAGKSTTLATLIDRINQTRRAHIVTIEDPIEYLHNSAKSLVNQRQVGLDAGSFNDALVASLRQDPDVILVGEIRDLATIRTAITAAETGHLVFTTVHAGDCVGTIERLVSVFPADEQNGIRRQLSLVLRCIIAQHLLVADGEQGVLPKGPDGVARRRRIVVSEVLTATDAVSHLIASGKSAQI